jgi:hypothetical protein
LCQKSCDPESQRESFRDSFVQRAVLAERLSNREIGRDRSSNYSLRERYKEIKRDHQTTPYERERERERERKREKCLGKREREREREMHRGERESVAGQPDGSFKFLSCRRISVNFYRQSVQTVIPTVCLHLITYLLAINVTITIRDHRTNIKFYHFLISNYLPKHRSAMKQQPSYLFSHSDSAGIPFYLNVNVISI